jgi:phage tail-like protein
MSPTTTDGMQAPAATPGSVVDPLAELSFLIEIQGREIGRFAQCTGLGVEYDVLEYAEGGNNEYVHQLRGRVRYPNVVLGRGITHEDELLRWLFTAEAPGQRPTVTITMNDPTGTAVRHFALSEALPVRWTGPSAQMGSSASAATETLEISHAGFV